MTHGHRDFTVCSCFSLPVSFCAGRTSAAKCSTTAEMSGEPVMRNARPKARRRIAAPRHCWSGCSQAPRPGRLPAVSTVTAYSPFPVGTATTRSSSTANSRLRHPMQVRTGPRSEAEVAADAAPEAEVSRWITAQSTSHDCLVRTTVGAFVRAQAAISPERVCRPPPRTGTTHQRSASGHSPRHSSKVVNTSAVDTEDGRRPVRASHCATDGRAANRAASRRRSSGTVMPSSPARRTNAKG